MSSFTFHLIEKHHFELSTTSVSMVLGQCRPKSVNNYNNLPSWVQKFRPSTQSKMKMNTLMKGMDAQPLLSHLALEACVPSSYCGYAARTILECTHNTTAYALKRLILNMQLEPPEDCNLASDSHID